MFDALLKVGGSLYRYPHLRRLVEAWVEVAGDHRLLALPGGGPFADAVRKADSKFKLSPTAAHWMAVLAMDQFAYLLADMTPNVDLLQQLKPGRQGKLSVLAPSSLLQQFDPLPHTWQVTSDSIAGWLAHFAGIPLLVMLKSAPGVLTAVGSEEQRLIEQVNRRELAKHQIVDPFFEQALQPGTECWIIDGRRPDRLQAVLARGQTIGTRIKGDE
jgi:aspartokinase-like uncharacterized kinase